MLGLLLKVLPGPSFLWRWGAIAVMLAAGAACVALKVHEHDELVLDEYKAAVKAAGDKQNALSAEKEKTWKQLVEATENEAKLRNDRLAADLNSARLRYTALAGRRIVPEATGTPGGSARVCYSAEQLDRGLREALGGLYKSVTGIAEEGQRARDLAAECVFYVRALK